MIWFLINFTIGSKSILLGKKRENPLSKNRMTVCELHIPSLDNMNQTVAIKKTNFGCFSLLCIKKRRIKSNTEYRQTSVIYETVLISVSANNVITTEKSDV